MKIGSYAIGPCLSPLVVAEISCNHMGQFHLAEDLVRAAAHCGAKAVKFQTFKPEQITAPDHGAAYIVERGLWAGWTLHQLYQEAYTPWEWLPDLFALAKSLNLEAFSAPFSPEAVEYLEGINCPAYKIASPEAKDPDLLMAVAATGKPALVSTGHATMLELHRAKHIIGDRFIPMHCVAEYPAPLEHMNLRRIQAFGKELIGPSGCVGLSDHSSGWLAPACAVALGASVIEKHLMLEGTTPLDGGFAMAPFDFGKMVTVVREAWQASMRPPDDAWPDPKEITRRLVFAERLPEGTPILPHHLRTARAKWGLAPGDADKVLGRTVRVAVNAFQPVTGELLD